MRFSCPSLLANLSLDLFFPLELLAQLTVRRLSKICCICVTWPTLFSTRILVQKVCKIVKFCF